MTRYLSDIATPERAVDELRNATNTTPSEADYARLYQQMTDYVRDASVWFENQCYRTFVPYVATETKPYTFRRIVENRLLSTEYGAWVLILHDTLLEVDSVVWNGTTLSASQYALDSADDTSAHTRLLIDKNASTALSDTFNAGVSITGTWAYHEDYTNAYTVIESVTITDSATSLSVTDADAYETRQYLKIEDELLQITARDTGTNTLTVTRGIRGTTATEHTSQTVSIYNPMPDVERAVIRIARWLYENRSGRGNTVQLGDASVILDDMPTAVKATIANYRRLIIGVV